MKFLTRGLLAAITLVAAACSSHGSSPGSPPSGSSAPATPVSCRQQYQNWKHGPAQIPSHHIKAALTAVQVAESARNAPAMKSAMQQLPPDVLAMANHPIPHCADPAGLFAEFLVRIYKVGNHARSAKGLGDLLLAASPLKGLKTIEDQLTLELRRTV